MPRTHDTSRPVRVAVYCRVSTEEQATEGFSIGTQLAQAEEWCARHLADREYRITNYKDEGLSGKLHWRPAKRGHRQIRPALASLVAALDGGEHEIVIVFRLDRLTRSNRVWADFCDEVIGTGKVRFVSLSESVDLNDAAGRMLAGLLVGVGAFQREVIGDNVRAGLRQRRKEGFPQGHHYGWSPEPPEREGTRRRVRPDPEQAPWVPRVFEWFLRGWSTERIAQYLDRHAVPLHPGATKWSRRSVSTMLRNSVNAGYIAVDGELVLGEHYDYRLIELETYEAAQREIVLRRRDGRPRLNHELPMLWHSCRCGLCGAPLTHVQSTVIDGNSAYRCHGSRDDYRETCKGWQKDTRMVDKIVLQQLTTLVQRPEFQALIDEEARGQLIEGDRSQLRSRLDGVGACLDAKREHLRRLLRLYTEGKVELDDYDAEYARLGGEIRALEIDLAEIQRRLSSDEECLALVEEVKRVSTQLPEIWGELNADERRHMLATVLEHAYLQPLGSQRHRIRIKFHFMPEVVADLPSSRNRESGLYDDIEHLTPRELAYLALHGEGLSDTQIARRWLVSLQAVCHYRRSALSRLQVATADEACRLAQGRIARERDGLPTEPPEGPPPPSKPRSMPPRALEALVRYIELGDVTLVAEVMRVRISTVRRQLWTAHHALGCSTVREGAEKLIELKGGKLPGYTEPLPLG